MNIYIIIFNLIHNDKKFQIISNEAEPIINKLSLNDIRSCPNFKIICSLKLNYQKREPNIKY